MTSQLGRPRYGNARRARPLMRRLRLAGAFHSQGRFPVPVLWAPGPGVRGHHPRSPPMESSTRALVVSALLIVLVFVLATGVLFLLNPVLASIAFLVLVGLAKLAFFVWVVWAVARVLRRL